MNDDFCVFHKRQELLRNLRKLGFVGQEIRGQSVNTERVFMAVALGVDVAMKIVVREFSVQHFHASQVQNTVTRGRGQAGGFGIEEDLAHG